MKKLYIDNACKKCMIDKWSDSGCLGLSKEIHKAYKEDLKELIYELPEDLSAPEMMDEIFKLRKRYSLDEIDYTDIKVHFNKIMLSYEDEISYIIKKSDDPLYCAICYAFVGNYIDFGTLSNVKEEKLKSLIETATIMELDKTEYSNLEKDLIKSKRLVYLTDNCGEIVLDKLLIKTINKKFPELDIQIIVRGKDVLNDATLKDAVQTGIDKISPVTENGTGYAGTVIDKINEKSCELIKNADLIISKGMGNFETLNGCGLNVYYMLMCKCEKSCTLFGKPLYSYLFLNDLRL